MVTSNESRSLSLRAVLLIIISVAGVGIGYATSILAARILGPQAFDDYAVIIASLGLLTAIAEAGVGKYALRVIPGYTVAQRWKLAAGYWRFSLRMTLLVSIVLATSVAVWSLTKYGDDSGDARVMAALFLPAAALAGVGVDFVMASRAAVSGALIARLLIPGTTLLLMASAGFGAGSISVSTAVACYGTGSLTGALLCGVLFRRIAPTDVFKSAPDYQRAHWMKECFSFAVIGFLTTSVFRISVVVLDLLPVPETQVAYFAAAMETGCLILLVAKSTDKLFQPELSIIIEQRDRELGMKIRRRRHLLIGTGCIVFLTIIAFSGQQILELYGPGFRAGYPALCWVSAGACIWTMYSLAPVYLRFVGQHRVVVALTGGAALLMVILTALLGIKAQATGAGAAFCIVLTAKVFLSVAFAQKNFSRLVAADNPASDDRCDD